MQSNYIRFSSSIFTWVWAKHNFYLYHNTTYCDSLYNLYIILQAYVNMVNVSLLEICSS